MSATKMSPEVSVYKKDALKAAKGLCYNYEVLSRIRRAQTVGEIERIMRSAREEEKYGR